MDVEYKRWRSEEIFRILMVNMWIPILFFLFFDSNLGEVLPMQLVAPAPPLLSLVPMYVSSWFRKAGLKY